MADSVVWNPIPNYEAAFVPKTWLGLRQWTADGPSDPDTIPPPVPRDDRIYEWRGPKLLVCA